MADTDLITPLPGTDPKLFARFMAKVQVTDECWVWKASTTGFGYGKLYVNGRLRGAHCVAWMLFRGELPEGIDVLHSCDNPPCIRPEHLFLGTARDNVADMLAKGRNVLGDHSRAPRGDAHWSRRNPERCARGKRSGAATHPEKFRGPMRWSSLNPEKVVRGEQAGMAKLTEEDVRAIRSAYADGESQESIGKRYGVSQPNIGCIVRRKTWTHVL